MVTIVPKIKIKGILEDLLKGGYFKKEWRNTSDVIEKMVYRGFTVKGRKVGMVARMLTQLCQNPNNNLERRPIESAKGKEKWKYKEVKNED